MTHINPHTKISSLFIRNKGHIIFYTFILTLLVFIMLDHSLSSSQYNNQVETYESACAPCGAPCNE